MCCQQSHERESEARVCEEREQRHYQTRNQRDCDGVTKHTEVREWQDVRRKKAVGKKMLSDVARSYSLFPKASQRMTFFFTNFPENFHAKHMLKAFSHYGDFEEVVIPARRDKIGKRFGFARAVNVREP